ncbi:MAG TPA: ACP S-malonyltransferase [Capillimicrobium sp.]|nr:ACP S-malonyltransferase [Capillimicrobium sp.]
MSSIAILFPGQGSQTDGMDEGLRDDPLMVRGLELLGFDPFARLSEGTRYQQPAIFLCSVVAWERSGIAAPVAAAGHSLGEYAALVAAGAIDFDAAVRLVALRGDAMARAGEAPGGAGSMVAVLGEDDDAVREAALEHGLTVANDNAPGQIVLSGPVAAVEAVDAGPLRTRRLDVSGAFHSPLMAPAAEELAAALEEVEIREPRFPVLSNGTAAPFADIRAELVENLLSPVRWRETVLALRELGADDFAELGPGRVLSGLVKRILREVSA